MFEHHRKLIAKLNPIRIEGKLSSMSGINMLVKDLPAALSSMCAVRTRSGETIEAQVVGFRDGATILMPLQDAGGAAEGDRVWSEPTMHCVSVGESLLGRVVDGLGRPIDQGPRIHAEQYYPVYNDAPAPFSRQRIDEPLSTGVRVIDGLLTVGIGQRLGIFSSTGVGKSVLLGMISRYTSADVTVVALVGERGREVKDFIEKDLGPEGMARTVMVVSTSDESPIMRVRASFVATAIAEYFRDQGRHVLLLVDSLTRLAMAQRQIGLAAGEPPASKGYTPSVFSLLPQLLERAGRSEHGSITGFYSVLVEGDDINEPISDAVRGILDGHVWLSRSLAGKGHYPAVDTLNSISRLMVDVVDEAHREAAQRVRRVLGTWFEIEDLVNIGAYAAGSNPQFDLAIQSKPQIDQFMQQAMDEQFSFEQTRQALQQMSRSIAETEHKLMAHSARGAAAG